MCRGRGWGWVKWCGAGWAGVRGWVRGYGRVG